jgi:integrase
VRELFEREPAAAFGPRKFKRVRQAMIESGRLNRKTINTRCFIIRDAFRFGVEEEWLPPDIAHGLGAVKTIGAGQYGARAGSERSAVDWRDVEPVLEYLPRPVRALVLLLWHTGARPSEILGLRPADIDRSNPDVWAIRLARHKNSHRGKARTIYLGPQAQRILAPFLLDRAATRACFRPVEAVREMRERRAAERQSPRWPAHVERYKREKAVRERQKFGETYSASALRIAVSRAIARENKEREKLRKAGENVPLVEPWAPYALRNAAATRFHREHGGDAARVTLGHASLGTTAGYVERDEALAAEVAKKSG